jgi:hypothetical protein
VDPLIPAKRKEVEVGDDDSELYDLFTFFSNFSDTGRMGFEARLENLEMALAQSQMAIAQYQAVTAKSMEAMQSRLECRSRPSSSSSQPGVAAMTPPPPRMSINQYF